MRKCTNVDKMRMQRDQTLLGILMDIWTVDELGDFRSLSGHVLHICFQILNTICCLAAGVLCTVFPIAIILQAFHTV